MRNNVYLTGAVWMAEDGVVVVGDTGDGKSIAVEGNAFVGAGLNDVSEGVSANVTTIPSDEGVLGEGLGVKSNC